MILFVLTYLIPIRLFFKSYFYNKKKIGETVPGMPEVSLPPFQIEYQNRTLSFKDVYTELGSGIIVVPLVGVLANVAIAKAFSKYRIHFVYLYHHRFACEWW